MSELGRRIAGHRSEQEQLIFDCLNELRHEYLTMSDKLEAIAGGVANHVLRSEQVIIPTAGSFVRDWSTPAGTIIVFNYSTHDMTLQVGGGGGAGIPSRGIGVATIKAGRWQAVPCNAHECTVYGTESDVCTIHVLTSMSFGGGVCA